VKQRTLAMVTGFEQYTEEGRRAIFLEEMQQVVPWRELCGLVGPHDTKPGQDALREARSLIHSARDENHDVLKQETERKLPANH
jgi:hypothetical protein